MSYSNLRMETYLRRFVVIFIGCSIIGFISIDLAVAMTQNHPPAAYVIKQWDLPRVITMIIAGFFLAFFVGDKKDLT